MALLGRSWRFLGPSWRLLGRSWPLPGRSWEAFGLPGELFFELFGSLFGAFEKSTKKQRFAAFLGSCCWLVLCGVFFALLATAVRERALKNMKIIWFLQCMAPVSRLRAKRKQRGTMKKNKEKSTQNKIEIRGPKRAWKTSKNESKSNPKRLQNRSWARRGTSWRSLGAFFASLGVSSRPLGALGASWAPLGALRKRF